MNHRLPQLLAVAGTIVVAACAAYASATVIRIDRDVDERRVALAAAPSWLDAAAGDGARGGGIAVGARGLGLHVDRGVAYERFGRADAPLDAASQPGLTAHAGLAPLRLRGTAL